MIFNRLARSTLSRRCFTTATPAVASASSTKYGSREREAIAYVFHAPSKDPEADKFQKKHVFIPSLGKGEVLVKTKIATICGSDLHTIAGTRKEPTPLILGHEGVGEVIESKNPNRHVGELVTWSVADSCMTCTPCVEHELPQKCDSLFKYGHAAMQDGSGLNGCYASHILLRGGTHIVPIPEELHSQLKMVAPANCALATVCNALRPSVLPKHGKTALVQGCGLLGLYSIAWLREHGYSTVFASDIRENRLSKVSKFGGVALDGSVSDDAFQARRAAIMDKTNGRGVDLVVEVCGVTEMLSEGVQMIRNGGHYVLAGLVHPDSALSSITGEQLIRKCVTMSGSHNYGPQHLDDAVKFLVDYRDKYPFDELISDPYPLDKLEDAVREAFKQTYARVSVSC